MMGRRLVVMLTRGMFRLLCHFGHCSHEGAHGGVRNPHPRRRLTQD
jgi:hypothetical protein